MKYLVLLVALILLTCTANAGEIHRSHAQVNLFKRTHICPATHTTLKSRQRCRGYVIDHVVALCKGGPDKATNMQYQTIAEAKAKDRVECK